MAVTGCKSSKSSDSQLVAGFQSITSEEAQIEGSQVQFVPRAVIYKTNADYSQYVPVVMDVSRTSIISYPAPSDIYYNGRFAVPIALDNGFLLDCRGINANVAFTDITYEQYAQLQGTITPDFLLKHILSAYPLEEMYVAPVSLSDDKGAEYFNQLIKHDFHGCTPITVKKQPKISIR